MKTRTLKTAGAIAIFVVVMTAQSVSAYYNPSTARWLSRDPGGETAGRNLLALLANNAIDNIDGLGLASVSYESDGRYYTGGAWYTFLGIPYKATYSSIGKESGQTHSPDANFWHVATSGPDTPLLCNTPHFNGENQSHVKATIKNNCKSSLLATCSCSISYTISIDESIKQRSALISGHVLDLTYNKAYPPMLTSLSGPHTYFAGGEDNILKQQTFVLAPGEVHELYYMGPTLTVGSLPGGVADTGGEFYERIDATCSCSVH